MKTPCYGCKKRTLTCHGHKQCKDYEEFREEKKKEAEQRRKFMTHSYHTGRTR